MALISDFRFGGAPLTDKYGRYTPGTHIPIYNPDKIAKAEPDYVLILPWNLGEEILTQLSFTGDWGGKSIIPIPEATIHGAGPQ